MRGKRILTGVSFIIALMALTISLTLAQGPGPQGEVSTQAALGTAFTYQGQLVKGDTPVDDTCDFQFTLWDAESGGSQVGSLLEKSGVSVTDGYFTVQLDFGSGAFTGDARWLQIEVKCTGETAYTDLGRQPITPAPYALFSSGAPWSGLTGVPAGFADGVDDDTTYTAGTGLDLTGTTFSITTTYRLPQGCNNGQIAEWDGSQWRCGDDDVGTGDITAVYAGTGLTGGGNTGDVTLSLDTSYTDGLYWKLTGNAGTDPATDFLGTTDDVTLTLKVSDTVALRLVPTKDTPNFIGGYEGNSVTNGVVGATIGGGGTSGAPNSVTADYGTVGGGSYNTASDYHATVGGGRGNTASSDFATVAGGWANEASGYAATVAGGRINTVSGNYATVGGGYDNIASGDYATVGGGSVNTAGGAGATVGGGGTDGTTYAGNQAMAPASTIGGGMDNLITTTADYATIAGGFNITVTADYATVGGGYSNTASGDYATVSGGDSNTASGYKATVGGGRGNTASGDFATVAGGWANEASGYAATVGGGRINTVSGDYATVSGGYDNIASGYAATVAGGYVNKASGDYSFAAGRRAKAYANGCFVWGDATNADITCTVQDAFIVRASGGVTMYTSSDLSTGATLQPGTGSWSILSDREAKENFEPVDPQAVLEGVAQLPISTWNYKAQDDSIRHIGPMAQDFYAAFGVGEDDKHISTVDADGVALAAIQGLYARVVQLEAENAAQQERIEALEARLADLEARLAAVEEGHTATGNRLFLPAAGLLLLSGVWAVQRRGNRP